ncbi:MAG: aminodeoxychorismate synthase component I [Thalassovita sp.]
MKLRFDHGPEGAPVWFNGAIKELVAFDPNEVDATLAGLDQALADGHWVAGFASYELGYLLEPRLRARLPRERRMPLLCFGLYQRPETAAPLEAAGKLSNLRPRWDQDQYAKAFAKVHELIAAGDIYQANLTFPIDADAQGSVAGIYAALAAHQPVQHGALMMHPELPDLLSRSPELFFRTNSQGEIETRPMKGTQPRSQRASEDAKARAFLENDPKNRAENLMIVDLLRNDLSRVSVPGTVKVPELFKVETYETVHQMTSLIRAQLRPKTGLSDIFRALFPCGSITGAPKLRAMEILSDLEPWPRDAYCGTLGWASPDGSSAFNVAIRTVMVEGRAAILNVGGGVVWDSTSPSEYEEALWKARFAQSPAMISV